MTATRSRGGGPAAAQDEALPSAGTWPFSPFYLASPTTASIVSPPSSYPAAATAAVLSSTCTGQSARLADRQSQRQCCRCRRRRRHRASARLEAPRSSPLAAHGLETPGTVHRALPALTHLHSPVRHRGAPMTPATADTPPPWRLCPASHQCRTDNAALVLGVQTQQCPSRTCPLFVKRRGGNVWNVEICLERESENIVLILSMDAASGCL